MINRVLHAYGMSMGVDGGNADDYGVKRYCLLVYIFLKTIVTKEKNTPYSRIIISVINKVTVDVDI